jgi:predicted transposase YbfD/YdcC
MQRHAATPKGLSRRLRDLQFERVKDPRCAPRVRYALPTLLSTMVSAMVSAARSLRDVEQRSWQITQKLGDWQGAQGRIADNTFGEVVPRLMPSSLVKRLHAQVKAEHRRGNLQPTHLPFGVAAIDGKNVATLHWPDLCRVLDLEPQSAEPKQVKARLRQQFPDLQFCAPKEGLPYALARVHTVTLISANAAVCLHQRPIPGRTNEIGAMPELLRQMHAAYHATHLVKMLTTDAGNTSLRTATQTVEKLHLDYFAQMKSEHGDLYTEAERVLGRRGIRQADASYVDTQNGAVVTYHVWMHDLSERGWLNWTHARQFVRVQRVTENATTGEATLGNRYYVCNKTPSELGAQDALSISRAHWRCEEETHWTADVVLREDRRRLAWSRHPVGVFVVAVLRMMALNILAVARKLSRLGYNHDTPTWSQVMQHFLLVLCGEALLTEEFDAVTE